MLALERLMVTAVKMADDRRVPARIGAGAGKVDHISFNRRLDRPDGKVETVTEIPPTPGAKLDPSLEFAPIDPEVRVLRVENTTGEVVASVINFACHPTCGSVDQPYTVSADYCGYAMNLIEAEEGGVCLFTPGCGGNIVPIERGGQSKRKVGVSLGAEALKVLQWIRLEDRFRLRAIRKDLEMPLREAYSFASSGPLTMRFDVEHARQQFEEKVTVLQEAESMSDLERQRKIWAARQPVILAERLAGCSAQMTEIQALAIGGIVLVGLPGEIVWEIGEAIRQQSGLEHIFTVISNDYVGYVVLEHMYEEGGYEANTTRSTIGTGEHVIEEGVALAKAVVGLPTKEEPG